MLYFEQRPSHRMSSPPKQMAALHIIPAKHIQADKGNVEKDPGQSVQQPDRLSWDEEI